MKRRKMNAREERAFAQYVVSQAKYKLAESQCAKSKETLCQSIGTSTVAESKTLPATVKVVPTRVKAHFVKQHTYMRLAVKEMMR